MAGIKNDVIFGLNGDFSSSDNISPSESNGLITDGQLWIGSTALNAGSTHINVGEITSPDNSITLGYSSPNITARVNRNVVQDLHTARFIVSPGGLTDGANYTTIQAAINAAAGTGVNQTVFIQPGTYAENLTLSPNINLVAYTADSLTPNVTILGKCTLSVAGTVTCSGINFQTNSDFAVVVSGSAASNLNFINCTLTASNNTFLSFTSSSASSQINFINCNGVIQTTGIALFAHSGAGSLIFRKCVIGNTSSTTVNTVSGSGFLGMEYTPFPCAISISGSAFCNISYCRINPPSNTTAVSITSSASQNLIQYTRLDGGTATALVVDTGATLITYDLVIASTNATAISGAGTINLGDINYINNSNNQVTTQNNYGGTGWQLLQTLTANNSATLTFTNLGRYRAYVFVINSILPATNATNLRMQVSNNNGSSFAASGYNSGINYWAYNSATVNNANATTFAMIAASSSNSAQISGTVYATPGNGNYWGTVAYQSTVTGVNSFGTCGGGSGIVFNAFQFSMSSGNITSGTISVYGIST